MDVSGQILKIISLLDTVNDELMALGESLQQGKGEITLFKPKDERSVEEKFDSVCTTYDNFERNQNTKEVAAVDLIKKESHKLTRAKPVFQCDLQTKQILKRYDSVTLASQATTINPTSISRCCRGQARHAGGFLWCFVKEGK